MNRPLAVLDTSILVFLLTQKQDDSPEEQDAERRRQLVVERIREMQVRYRWGIPSVVVAELGRQGPAEVAVRALGASLARFRILPLDYKASCIAARIASSALKARLPGSERGAVKYDALICATAIAQGGECIVTENPRDYRKHVAQAGATLDIIVPSEVPAAGQLHLLHSRRSE